MKNSTQAKNIEETRVQSIESAAGVDTISKGVVYAMGGVSSVIGIWAISCFVYAASVAGPLEFMKGFVTAVTGM